MKKEKKETPSINQFEKDFLERVRRAYWCGCDMRDVKKRIYCEDHVPPKVFGKFIVYGKDYRGSGGGVKIVS